MINAGEKIGKTLTFQDAFREGGYPFLVKPISFSFSQAIDGLPVEADVKDKLNQIGGRSRFHYIEKSFRL